jgi:tetratricopeptide (TPR) repeat protein
MLKLVMPNIKTKKNLSILPSGWNSKVIYTVCAITALVTLSIFNLSFFYSQQYKALNNRIVLGAKTNTDSRLDYWYNMASQHPNYIVAWLEIAKLEHQRGNHQAVLNAIKFAEAIEPNIEELARTKKELGL